LPASSGLRLTHLDGKLAAVFAQAVQLAAFAHRPHPRLVEIAGAMLGMLHAEAFGHQNLHALTEQLFPLIAEHRFRLRV
jgi:hypothetical protein